jgi:hypothetical protein
VKKLNRAAWRRVAGAALPVHPAVNYTVAVDPNMTIRDLSSLLALILGMLLVLAA